MVNIEEDPKESSVFSVVNKTNLTPVPSSLSPISCILPPFYNIGSGNEISIKDIAFMIKDIVGLKGGIIFDKTKPDGTLRKLLDVSKLFAMGWSSQVALKNGIENVCRQVFK